MPRLRRARRSATGVLVALALAAVSAPGPCALAASAGIEIDQVEFTGATVVTEPELEAALELGTGDILEEQKLFQTEKNIRALYVARGYEQVAIQSRLTHRHAGHGTLEFAIKEGKPVRIAAISFSSELPAGRSPGTEDLQRLWVTMKPALEAKTGLAQADVYDQDKIATAKRNLQDYLAGREFVGAKVEDAQVVPLQTPPGQEAVVAARWVAVKFEIFLGDRVSFGFRGNTVFAASRLAALVEDQRVLGLGKDYVSSIRTRIEDEYHAVGYAQVKVEALTFERSNLQERHVTYVIHEGPRVRIETVDFDGNLVFSNSQLQKEFHELASIAVQGGYYVEKDVQKAAQAVVDWIKSKGYLTSRLITVNTFMIPPRHTREEERAVRLVIYLYESDQTIVQSLSLKGLQALTIAEAKQILNVKEGAPLDLVGFGKGVETLKEACRARGYLGMKLVNEEPDKVVLYSQEGRYADLVLDIDEGPRFRVSRVIVEGLTFTEEPVVRREFLFREGEVLREPDLVDTEARLRRLGIFSVVTVRAADDAERPGFKIVRVSLQEGTPGLIAGGVGFRNDLGVRGFGELGYTNLWGKNHSLLFDLTANRRLQDFRPYGTQILQLPGQPPLDLSQFSRENYIEYQAQLSYRWPWFMGNDIDFRPSFAVGHTEYILFDAFTMTSSLTWEKRFLSEPRLTGSLTYSLERVNQTNPVPGDAEDQQDQTIGSITPALRLDTRDNPLAPTSGLFAVTSLEWSEPWMFSRTSDFSIGYTRFQVRTDYSIPLPGGVIGFFSFRSGLLRNTQPQLTLDQAGGNATLVNQSGSVPLIKQFTLGGAGSLRGYGEQELNSQTLQIHGIQSYVNYRTQVDLPFSGGLRLGVFLDAGNLQVDTYSLGNLHYGTGAGLHYLTPVGPVNFDLGFKLFPRPGEETGPMFYFSIGVI